jgi:hypothetical protein
MTRTDIISILSDGDKNTKYIIIRKAYHSVNGIDLYPVVAKKKDIRVGWHLQVLTLSDKNGTFRQIEFDRIENIVKYDDCIFGR